MEDTRKRMYEHLEAPSAGSVIEAGEYRIQVEEETVTIHRAE